MSVEVLETIKEQTKSVTPQERKNLVDYLQKSNDKIEASDLGLKGDASKEKRHLRDGWMKSEINRQKYGGIYAALDGDRLVATGKNYAEASEQAKKSGAADFVVDFVLPLDYVGEIGGWE